MNGMCLVWFAAALMFWSCVLPVLAKKLEAKRPAASQIKPVRLSLKDAVGIAMRRNLRVQSRALTITQREQERRAAFSDMLPQITVQYGAVADRYQNLDFIDELDQKHPSRWTERSVTVGRRGIPEFWTPLYPYRIDPYRNFQLSATVTQPLYRGGQLTNAYKNADLGVAGSALDLEILKEDLTLQVIQAHYQLILGKKLVQVADESIRSLQAFKARAQAFFKEGEGLQIDVKAAEAQLAQAKAQRQQAITSVGTALSQLNLLLGNPQTTKIAVDEHIPLERSVYRIPAIYEIAVANRLEIRRAGISAEQARASVKIAQAGLLPRVDLQLQGLRINDDWNVFDPEGTNDWTVQGTLTWAFDMFRGRSTVQRQRSATSQTLVDRQYLIQQILQQTHAAYLDIQRSNADVTAYKEAVAARTDQFSMAKELYNQQMTTYLQVLEAQDGLVHAKANLFSAKTSLVLATAQLERQMGILRNRFAGNSPPRAREREKKKFTTETQRARRIQRIQRK